MTWSTITRQKQKQEDSFPKEKAIWLLIWCRARFLDISRSKQSFFYLETVHEYSIWVRTQIGLADVLVPYWWRFITYCLVSWDVPHGQALLGGTHGSVPCGAHLWSHPPSLELPTKPNLTLIKTVFIVRHKSFLFIFLLLTVDFGGPYLNHHR